MTKHRGTGEFHGTLWITGEPDVDGFVNQNPLALIIAMLLDQQISIELAFRGPSRLRERMTTPFTAQAIADYEPAAFTDLCRTKPALHRFPGSMATRIQLLCGYLADHYEGDPQRLWCSGHDQDAGRGGEPFDAATVRANLETLPGYGPEKSRILLAVLAKRFGIAPENWEAVAAPFSDHQPRSVADMGSEDEHQAVREWKAVQKAAGRSKSD
jgi:uncharacterized HhH-GPD family protein